MWYPPVIVLGLSQIFRAKNGSNQDLDQTETHLLLQIDPHIDI